MKIAIVCGSPNSEFLAPFDDDSWGIWVLGNRIQRFKDKRVTRIFEIHDDLSEHGDANKYAEHLLSYNIPMVVGEGFPVQSPLITTFPFAKAKELFGSTYLTSSPAYMVALAILEGATHIGLYGVDMAVDDHEYFWQRPCMEAWVGFAKGRGIEVTIPAISPVCRSDYIEGMGAGGKPDFALAPFTQKEFAAMAQQHANKMAAYQAQIREIENAIHLHSGAQQAYERLVKVARGVEAGNDIKTLTDSAIIK